MESRKFSSAKQPMENMTHFMEKGNNIIMAHESRFFGGWFRQICYHRCKRIVARAIDLIVTRKNRPDSSMGILGIYGAKKQ